MKLKVILLSIGIMQGSWAWAAAPLDIPAPASVTQVINSQYQTDMSFNSLRLPRWSFRVNVSRELPRDTVWIDEIDNLRPIDSIRLQAHRALDAAHSQRIFAALQTSNTHHYHTPNRVYLPDNAGIAAALGWELGQTETLNLAVEYEYREVGELELSSVVIGVQYFF